MRIDGAQSGGQLERGRGPGLAPRLRRARRRGESGQALVESAIVMPLLVFIILGVIQLSMIQHARIMTEYAAFNAARAGIVWNGDPWVMENAAIISLLPTYEGLGDEMGLGDPGRMLTAIVQRALLYQVNRRLTGFAREMFAGPLSDLIRGAFGGDGPDVVEVTVLNPTRDAFGDTEEIDFDDLGNDDTAASLREANRLTIQIRYLYIMRVPFANWVMHHAWLSQRAGISLYGSIWNPQGEVVGATGFSADDVEVSYEDISRGLAGDDDIIRDLARAGREGVYIIPLYATYTMRMQSNLFLMHF
jgi:hypothetical protein